MILFLVWLDGIHNWAHFLEYLLSVSQKTKSSEQYPNPESVTEISKREQSENFLSKEYMKNRTELDLLT